MDAGGDDHLVSGEVTLREVRDEDLPVFFEHQADPAAVEMAAFPSREEAPFLTHWRKILADPAVLARTVLADGEVAGNVVSFTQAGEREVGYWLGRAWWGRGTATRALAAFLRVETRRPLAAHVASHNLASRRVLEKNGFVLDPASSAGEELVLRLE